MVKNTRPVTATKQLTDRDKNNSSSNRMNVCRDEKSFNEDPNTARAIIAGLEKRSGVQLPMEDYRYFLNLVGITGVNEL